MSAWNQISKILCREHDDLFFKCPGCHCIHGVQVDASKRPRWEWNGNVDKPTFKPSLLVRSAVNDVPTVCHSFITDGQIQFLGDCTHELAGQTVAIPDWD